MTLKEVVTADLSVFYNTDEFAETVVYIDESTERHDITVIKEDVEFEHGGDGYRFKTITELVFSKKGRIEYKGQTLAIHDIPPWEIEGETILIAGALL